MEKKYQKVTQISDTNKFRKSDYQVEKEKQREKNKYRNNSKEKDEMKE